MQRSHGRSTAQQRERRTTTLCRDRATSPRPTHGAQAPFPRRGGGLQDTGKPQWGPSRLGLLPPSHRSEEASRVLVLNAFPTLANQRLVGRLLVSPLWPPRMGLSGRRQAPLPREWAAVVSELKKRPRPRSPSFTMPVAVMNTLAGLMSAGEEEGVGVASEGQREAGSLGDGGPAPVLLPPQALPPPTNGSHSPCISGLPRVWQGRELCAVPL